VPLEKEFADFDFIRTPIKEGSDPI